MVISRFFIKNQHQQFAHQVTHPEDGGIKMFHPIKLTEVDVD